MNVVLWARVSSREQREGYSIDAQLRSMRNKAERDSLKIVHEFVVAESAKKGAERKEFNKMMKWIKSNARKLHIDGILSHKLDRVCRNIRDAVRLQELENQCGVKVYFVDNQFGEGAAGQLSFNVMASVAQYYSENLRSEVLKGMNEKVRQGWLPANAPYGYYNDTADRNEPIKPHPKNSGTVHTIFELYSKGNMTFKSLSEILYEEGHVFRQTLPKFTRNALSYILNNTFYIGEIVWHGRIFQGKHRPLIDRHTFNECQNILSGKNRRKSKVQLPLAGGLFQCKYCGQGITGEKKKKKKIDGSYKDYIYYRCANNEPSADHPNVRWREKDFEEAILAELKSIQLPTEEVREWFRDAIQVALNDEAEYHRQHKKALRKRETELEKMRDRLLNAYLNGSVDEKIYNKKMIELKYEQEQVKTEMLQESDDNTEFNDVAIKVFDFSQKAVEIWKSSNNSIKRELLEILCLEKKVGDVSLELVKRKPFEILSKRPFMLDGRGEKI